jgi:hypothetical protein
LAKPSKNVHPWHPADYSEAVTGAIKALAAGNANEGQQKLALDWIIVTLCGTYDQPYRPGSERDTVFACAKQYVGQQIVKQMKLVSTKTDRTK